MAELRFCKPAVVGSTPTASSVLKSVMALALRCGTMGVCPSGQWGQTVNLVAMPSQVRILSPPLGSPGGCVQPCSVESFNRSLRNFSESSNASGKTRRESEESVSRPARHRGCSSMVEFQPSKLATWVRFPSPALWLIFRGSAAVAQLVECVLGKDEVLGSNPSSSLTGVLPVW